MRKPSLLSPFVVFICLIIITAMPSSGFGRQSASLKEGIEQYNRENFEEAVEALTKARSEDPASAEAAFYLGMAYRQTNDIANAYRQFEDAVNLRPLTDNAILEMIEVSTILDKFDVARKWIAVAEEHKVYPARVAFLKGSALMKEAKYDQAVAAFEKSKKLDPAYTQAADFQIGICYMNQKQYARARDLFQSAVTRDPLSDMASYARRYQEAAEQRRYLERPLRFSIGVTGQYDTNFRALGDSYDGAPITYNEALEGIDRRGFVMQNMVRLDYVPMLPAPFIFTAGYAFLNRIHQRYGTDNDTIANSFTLAPGGNFERFAVNLVANYTHTLKREPNYRRYSEVFSAGPLFRYLLGKGHILDLGGSSIRKNFFRAVSNPEYEDQSSSGWDGSVGWTWLFKENGMFSLKAVYSRENAEGLHYDNRGYRVSAGLIYPLAENFRLQLGSEFLSQDFKNENVFFDNTVRKDRTYTGSIGLTWSVRKYLDMNAQYLHTKVDSNIYVYDYNRDVFSLGVELKF
ncbi:MAG: tetratricopeptide repeat protein [Deltaproteobacteria bacterium]|nr:tetratricopeptide repeat protein [Deltaproteobacteria bacterium]